jgi:hypothetical protein
MKACVIASLVALSGAVFGEGQESVAPYQWGLLMPHFALEEPTTRINGYVTGFWTENPQSALSISVFNGATGDSKGMQFGGFSSYAENYAGVQLAPFNSVANDFCGVQLGGFNYVHGTCNGLQLGVMNVASKANGLQVGLMNVATEQYGLQIGILNINTSNKFLAGFPSELSPGMPIVNWKF